MSSAGISTASQIEGVPIWHQYWCMLQKLLSSRFGLQMDYDKRRTLRCAAIIVAKGGPHLEKSKKDPDGPSDRSGDGIAKLIT